MLDQQKNKNLSARRLVEMEETTKGPRWESIKQQKSKILEQIGQGEDLLLTHLAVKISEQRPTEQQKVYQDIEYESLFSKIESYE